MYRRKRARSPFGLIFRTFYFIILFLKFEVRTSKMTSSMHKNYEVVAVYEDDTCHECPIKREREGKESRNQKYCVKVPTKGPTGKAIKSVWLHKKPDSKPLLLHKGPIKCSTCQGCDEKTMELCFPISVFRELNSLIRKSKEEEKS